MHTVRIELNPLTTLLVSENCLVVFGKSLPTRPPHTHICWCWVMEPNLGAYRDLKFKVVKKGMGNGSREMLWMTAMDSKRIMGGAGQEE